MNVNFNKGQAQKEPKGRTMAVPQSHS